MHRLLAVALLFVFNSSIGHAAPADQPGAPTLAAHVAELAWEKADAAYTQMVDGEADFTAEDHYLGARAAAELGDIGHWLERLRRAKAEGHAKADQTLLFATSAYGQVSLELKSSGGRVLKAAFRTTDPVKRRAILVAATALRERGKFEGWLPCGSYRLGARYFNVRPHQ